MVTPYTGPTTTAPAPKRRWPHALVALAILAALLWLADIAYWSAARPPPATEVAVVTRVVTVRETAVPPVPPATSTVAPTATTRTLTIYIDQTAEVTRIVYVNTYYTPTPPAEGRG